LTESLATRPAVAKESFTWRTGLTVPEAFTTEAMVWRVAVPME
jgi:hypothetical protein